jgi:hypothetical protein
MRKLAAIVGLALALFGAAADRPATPDYAYVAAAQYDSTAWRSGHERFPGGAAVMLVTAQGQRKLAPDFYASTDPAVSFDGLRILFAGKRTAAGPWQIWETAIAGGAPRQLTAADTDCIRPLYLPDGRVVYTRVFPRGSEIQIVPLSGAAAPETLTFVPGWYLTDDVLHDGRILFETGGDLWTVYPDGTGVETIRCDHGPQRANAHQAASGDVIFNVGKRLARFTPALAEQTGVRAAQPGSGRTGRGACGRSLADPAAQQSQPPVSSLRLDQVERPARRVESRRARQRRRTGGGFEPRSAARFSLGPRAHTHRREPAVPQRARIENADRGRHRDGPRLHAGCRRFASVLLGQTVVESDGSFYVQVPADRPLRMELLGRSGAVTRAEKNWFWMRPSEQRICVGCHAGPERSPENRVPEILNRTTVPVNMTAIPGQTK